MEDYYADIKLTPIACSVTVSQQASPQPAAFGKSWD